MFSSYQSHSQTASQEKHAKTKVWHRLCMQHFLLKVLLRIGSISADVFLMMWLTFSLSEIEAASSQATSAAKAYFHRQNFRASFPLVARGHVQ